MQLQRFLLLASALHAASAHRQPPKKPLEAASLFQSAAAPVSPLPIIQLYKPVCTITRMDDGKWLCRVVSVTMSNHADYTFVVGANSGIAAMQCPADFDGAHLR